MSFATSLPPGDKSLTPITSQSKVFTVETKHYTLSTNFYDIGDYLTKLNIQMYQTILITLKGGSYRWEKSYTMPKNSNLYLIGEGFENNGKNNKVSILMGEKNTQSSNGQQLAKNIRLVVTDGCTCKIEGINIFEKINDNRKLALDPNFIGIFSVHNSKFYFLRGMIEAADSPIINVPGQCIGNIFFGHSYFERNPMSFNTEIKIVGTLTGWGFSGNKAIVSNSHTTLGNGCVLQPNNKIEILN